MPRRRDVPERPVISDPKYDSKLVTKFINCVMRDGKKSTAEALLYDAFEIMKKKVKESPVKLFEQAVDNVRPLIEVKSRRVGGSTYQVPTEIRKKGWPKSWRRNSWMQPTTAVLQLRKGKTPIKWRKPTKRSPIFAGNAEFYQKDIFHRAYRL
jgi:hypothetical protein